MTAPRTILLAGAAAVTAPRTILLAGAAAVTAPRTTLPARAAAVAATRTRLLAAGLALLACAWPAGAAAQEPGTAVGGTVPSFLQLGLDVPATLGTFASTGGAAAATIEATITATDAPVSLSVADGDSEAAPRRGHLVFGGRALADPLEAAAGGAPFQALDVPLDPLLMRWTGALAGRRTAIRLRQRAGARLSAAPGAKTLLITVSTETP